MPDLVEEPGAGAKSMKVFLTGISSGLPLMTTPPELPLESLPLPGIPEAPPRGGLWKILSDSGLGLPFFGEMGDTGPPGLTVLQVAGTVPVCI
jgi:hypothetical protein